MIICQKINDDSLESCSDFFKNNHQLPPRVSVYWEHQMIKFTVVNQNKQQTQAYLESY